MNVLLWLLPDSFLPALVVLVAIGLVVGVVRPRSAGSIVGTILLVLLAGPFIEAVIGSMPAWISLVILFVMGLALLRFVMEKLFGEHVAGHLVAHALIRGVPAVFRLAWLPVRGLFWLITRAFSKATQLLV